MRTSTHLLHVLNSQLGKAALVALSAYFIFQFGKSIGEFAYYFQH
ncbi:hypothetical protein [Hymenobacter mucosus]|nr:hypothetical protein [Hymenobacter mucosus]